MNNPIRRVNDWNLDFLTEFAEFLLSWETSKKPGLTREKFLALRQMCTYVAARLRNSSSHPMRVQLCSAWSATIRWHRILFWMVGSTLWSELLRVDATSFWEWPEDTCAVTHEVFPAILWLKSMKLLRLSSAAHDSLDSSTADAISDKLTYQTWPSTSDANIIYYISGAVARSVIRSTRCDQCKSLNCPWEHCTNPTGWRTLSELFIRHVSRCSQPWRFVKTKWLYIHIVHQLMASLQGNAVITYDKSFSVIHQSEITVFASDGQGNHIWWCIASWRQLLHQGLWPQDISNQTSLQLSG